MKSGLSIRYKRTNRKIQALIITEKLRKGTFERSTLHFMNAEFIFESLLLTDVL